LEKQEKNFLKIEKRFFKNKTDTGENKKQNKGKKLEKLKNIF